MQLHGSITCLNCIISATNGSTTCYSGFVWYVLIFFVIAAAYSWLLPSFLYLPGWRGKLTFIMLTLTENLAMLSMVPYASYWSYGAYNSQNSDFMNGLSGVSIAFFGDLWAIFIYAFCTFGVFVIFFFHPSGLFSCMKMIFSTQR